MNFNVALAAEALFYSDFRPSPNGELFLIIDGVATYSVRATLLVKLCKLDPAYLIEDNADDDYGKAEKRLETYGLNIDEIEKALLPGMNFKELARVMILDTVRFAK